MPRSQADQAPLSFFLPLREYEDLRLLADVVPVFFPRRYRSQGGRHFRPLPLLLLFTLRLVWVLLARGLIESEDEPKDDLVLLLGVEAGTAFWGVCDPSLS